MKAKQFKHGFFMLLILSVLMVSFNGCDKDDDDDNVVIPATFLELYVGTTWALDDDGGIPDDEGIPAYFRFINDSNKILEGWYEIPSDELDCYYYNDGINVDNGVLQIIENTANKIVIKITYDATESETFTCTITGDTLKIEYVYKEVGWPDEVYTLFFDKTTVDVDNLPLCP